MVFYHISEGTWKGTGQVSNLDFSYTTSIKCFKSLSKPSRVRAHRQRLQGIWRTLSGFPFVLCKISMLHHTVPGTGFPGAAEDTSCRKIIIFQRLEDKLLLSRECTTGKEWSPTLPCSVSGSKLLSHGSFWHPQGVFYFFLHILSGLSPLFCTDKPTVAAGLRKIWFQHNETSEWGWGVYEHVLKLGHLSAPHIPHIVDKVINSTKATDWYWLGFWRALLCFLVFASALGNLSGLHHKSRRSWRPTALQTHAVSLTQ